MLQARIQNLAVGTTLANFIINVNYYMNEEQYELLIKYLRYRVGYGYKGKLSIMGKPENKETTDEELFKYTFEDKSNVSVICFTERKVLFDFRSHGDTYIIIIDKMALGLSEDFKLFN